MVKITRFIHTTIRIKSKGTIIYIDPYKIANDDKADYIFITHDHYDHLSIEDIKKLLKKETKIFVPNSVIPKVLQFSENNNIGFDLNEKLELDGFSVDIVPAYNTDKEFHKQNTDWCGFIITIENGFAEGYITEKLCDTLICNRVIIYFGDPNIEKTFPNLFPNGAINGFKFKSLDNLIYYIKNMSDDEYLDRIKIINQERLKIFKLYTSQN